MPAFEAMGNWESHGEPIVPSDGVGESGRWPHGSIGTDTSCPFATNGLHYGLDQMEWSLLC